jgi:1,4-alpha-glucan branching enzyme
LQKNADGGDMYVTVYAAVGNHIQFTVPFIVPAFNLSNEAITGTVGQPVPVTAVASTAGGTINLYFNGAKINGPVTGTASISGNPVVTGTGIQRIVAELVVAGISYYDTVQFYLPPANIVLALPPAVKQGINYWPGCDSVTLVLYAPNKNNVAVLGDFPNNNWLPQSQYQMNKTPDGNYYWLTIRGLTGGTEYAFEYLVDNIIYIADPYSEKVLDPWNDGYIPAATYPAMKAYPSNPNVSAGANGILSVLQTCATPYKWQVTNFVKPDKRNLIAYELLVRDFGDARNYQMLIDTMAYFKRLGINAIELMPVSEFSGNESWGYNPEFYLALDKAYGTKDKFKEFIDLCHRNGIAVILDVVYNQLDAFNAPEGKLYWDAVNNRPAANNPWLNPAAPHPYSVFNDLNHTSAATQYWVARALEYWISEYKVDGYRFDLAKGFTQTVSNDTTVENYDQSRVDNLSRYYDSVVPKFPGTYMILEFLGQYRSEENAYARKGFMLWGNSNYAYNQNTMGYSEDADFSKIVYNSGQEQFSTPAEMGYMESHDEERLMYKNLQYGNSSGSYNVKALATALDRQTAAAAVFFMVPGPKMLWQFGERGYDISIGFNGRTGNKPPHWEYMADPGRLKLYNAYSKLINLRLSNPDVFNNTVFSYDFNDSNRLYRRFQITDPSAAGMSITVVANFDVVPQTRAITFQTAGNWYNYLANGTGTGNNGQTGNKFNLAVAAQSITLQPGEYHVYIYQPANVYSFIGNGNWSDASNWSYNTIPPSPLPAGSEIYIAPLPGGECILNGPLTVVPGAKFIVVAGKNFRIP